MIEKRLFSWIWDEQQVRMRIDRAVHEAAEQFAQDVKLNMIRSKPRGRAYRRFGKIHIASAPGQPPARDTGRLINSIKSVKRAVGFWETGVGASYGLRLDIPLPVGLGRPFFASVLKANRDHYVEIMRDTLFE